MRYIEKSDGNGNIIRVEDPNLDFNIEDGQKKFRRKPTNFKPKKKKRKKH